MKHDATLEEMWRIKEELSAPHDSWEEYAAAIYSYQEEERRRGVRFLVLPPCTAREGLNAHRESVKGVV